jgi:hypothetical protein
MLKNYSKKEFKEFIGSLVFFLLWPFGSLIHSLKNNKKIWAKNTFWIFCVFYGYNLIIYSSGLDGYRYSSVFLSWGQQSWSFYDFINSLYTVDTRTVDIVEPLITYILSRFTDDTRILFAVYALVFGYFYSRNLWYLLERVEINKSIITIIFITTFSLIMPIYQISAFRFATATHVFFYGVFPFLFDGNKRKIWIAVLSIFVHFTFISPVIILVLYSIFGNRYKIYFILFLLSLLLKEINQNIIKAQFEFLPAVFQFKSDAYLTSDAMIKQYEKISATNWYIQYYNKILNWVAYIFIISLYIKARKKIIVNNRILSIFSFTMLFYSFVNIVNLMPQGIRFSNVGAFMFFFMVIYLVNEIELSSFILKLRTIIVPFLIVIIAVAVRKGLDYTSLVTVLGNPLIALAVDNNLSLIDLFK